MNRYTITITEQTTTKELKEKIAAFKTLYGESEVLLKGHFTELYNGKYSPVFSDLLGFCVTDIGSKYIKAYSVEDKETIIVVMPRELPHLYSYPKMPFQMIITTLKD